MSVADVKAPKLPLPRSRTNHVIGYEIENRLGQRLVVIPPYNPLCWSGTAQASPTACPLMYGTREEAESVVEALDLVAWLKVVGPIER
jgi:hypothetical protein